MPSSLSNRQRQLFALLLLALLPAGKAVEPCLDWDTWWHLRVGQYIVDEQKLPDHDPFSQLGREQNIPWTAYSWLYELMLYGAFRAGDAAGVLIFRHLLFSLAFGGMAWFFLRHSWNHWLGLGVLGLVTISLLPFSSERPWHFTIFFTTLTLHAVLILRDGVSLRRCLWVPLIYVLWANIHIQFVMGFALLGLGWLVTLIEWRIKRDQTTRLVMWRLFILGVICTLATLITPFHYRLYIVVWEYASQTRALKLVMELQPPVLTEWYNWPLIVLLLAASYRTAQRGYRLWDIVLLASALFFSMRMQRDLWYGVLAAGAVVVREQRRTPPPAPPRNGEGSKPFVLSPSALRGGVGEGFSPWQVAIVVVLALLLMRGVWEAGLSRGKTIEKCHAETYPVKAAQFVREQHYSGPLFNDFDWGGYLIWALPEYPVSMDGRTNLYGEERLIRSFDTWAGESGWENNPELQKANVIIAPKKRKEKEFPLTELLRGMPQRWRIIYEDDTAAVFESVKAP